MSTAILSITLYPQQNKVHFAASQDKASKSAGAGDAIHQFKHRWECQLLALLWLEGQVGRALTDTVLQQSLRQKGQVKELNRAQLQRLFAALNEFLSQLPDQPLRLQAPPRKATVGPWALVFAAPVRLHEAQAQSLAPSASAPWPHPLLLTSQHSGHDGPGIACVDQLHQLLSQLLTADTFALNGDYAEAIDTVKHIYSLPLTAEGRCLVWLREAVWQKRLGHFEAARTLVGQVLANPPSLDPALLSYARFLLQRFAYDEAPAQVHASLWHSVTLPDPMQGADCRVLPEWHNLRALLARRRLLSLPASDASAPAGEAMPNSPAALHHCALHHFESAIYWLLQQRDWDHLLAFVANIGFHLQSMLPLGLATVHQVFDWHCLCVDYGDKLNLAQDSGWEFIFFGEFWLDHHPELISSGLTGPLAHTVDDAHPRQQKFYIQALDKLKKCADPRQLVIMWVLYSRFVASGMQSSFEINDKPITKKELAKLIQNAIAALLESRPSLLPALREEGYGAWLSADSAASRR